MAVESLPLPLARTLPGLPTRAQAERYRAAIAIAAASVFVTGIGTVYLHGQAAAPAVPAVRIAGPVAVAAPAQAIPVTAPGHDAGPLRANGDGTATDVSEKVLGPIMSPSNDRSTSDYRKAVSRARSAAVATTSSGARIYSTSGASSTSSSSATSTSISGSHYLVQSGDDFGAIGAKFGLSAERVAALNPGVDSTQLSIGQTLRVH